MPHQPHGACRQVLLSSTWLLNFQSIPSISKLRHFIKKSKLPISLRKTRRYDTKQGTCSLDHQFQQNQFYLFFPLWPLQDGEFANYELERECRKIWKSLRAFWDSRISFNKPNSVLCQPCYSTLTFQSFSHWASFHFCLKREDKPTAPSQLCCLWN